MRKISYTNRFLKDYKQIKKRGWDIQQLEAFIDMLATNQPLPPSARPHKLSGKYRHAWDAHVGPDWILIYEIDNNHLILRRTGTHAVSRISVSITVLLMSQMPFTGVI